MRCNIVVSDLLFLQYGRNAHCHVDKKGVVSNTLDFTSSAVCVTGGSWQGQVQPFTGFVYQIDEDLECHIPPKWNNIEYCVHGT